MNTYRGLEGKRGVCLSSQAWLGRSPQVASCNRSMGTIEKKKERGAGMAFLQSLLREVPSTLFSLCWPCRGPNQGLDFKRNPKCFERAVAKYVGCERMVSTALVT